MYYLKLKNSLNIVSLNMVTNLIKALVWNDSFWPTVIWRENIYVDLVIKSTISFLLNQVQIISIINVGMVEVNKTMPLHG